MKRMKKQFLALIWALILMFTFQQVFADGTCGTNVKYTVSGTTISFSRMNNTSGAVWKSDCGEAFKNDPDIRIVKVTREIRVEKAAGMFAGFQYVEEMDLSKLDVSDVDDMSNMFSMEYDKNKQKVLTSLKKLDVSTWDTSNVANMSGMFSNCSSLTGLDVGGWDTSKVTDMSSMFLGCKAMTSLDLSSWKTNRVISMMSMFEDCSSLSNLNADSWNTSAVRNMSGMFSGCSSLVSLDLSSFDTSDVKDNKNMFSGCETIRTLILGKKTLDKNICKSLPAYNNTWYYLSQGPDAGQPLKLKTEKKGGNLFGSYNYNTMAGIWSTDPTPNVRALLIGEVTFLRYSKARSFYIDPSDRNIAASKLMEKMLSNIGNSFGGDFLITRKADLSYDQIKEAIKTTFIGTTEDDISLFYILSHGYSSSDGDLEMPFLGNLSDYSQAYRFYMSGEGVKKLPFSVLANWLSTYVKGKVIVIIGSCGSGSAIYDPVEQNSEKQSISKNDYDEERFLQSVIKAFETEDLKYQESLPEAKSTGDFRNSKFFVLTSSRHREMSWGHNVPTLGNWFTDWLVEGVGTKYESPADTNGDSKLDLTELFEYIKKVGDPHPFIRNERTYHQHVQRYPVGSNQVFFWHEPDASAVTISNSEGTDISQKTVKLEASTFRLKASAVPNKAAQEFTWKSSDTKIAEVDKTGKVTFQKAGTVKITAAAKDGSGVSNWVELKTDIKTTKVTITNSAGTDISGKTIKVTKKTFQLSASADPAAFVPQEFTWKSSDKKIAAVDSQGKVTFKKSGTVKITAAATDGSGVSAWVKLTTDIKTTKVTISDPAGTDISGKTVKTAKKTYQLSASADPAAFVPQEFTWKSSSTKIAEVDKTGKVTFKKAGTVKITAAATDGSGVSNWVKLTTDIKTTKVTISDPAGTDISGKTVKVPKKTYQLSASAEPAGFVPQEFTWKSSDESIAAVDATGKVTFKKAGTVKITATAKDGSGAFAAVKLTTDIKATRVTIRNANGKAVSHKTLQVKTKTVKLKAVAIPAKFAAQKFTWKSSNRQIAAVKAGKVTFKKAGTVKITATASDGSRKSNWVKITYKPSSKNSAEPEVIEIPLAIGETGGIWVEPYSNTQPGSYDAPVPGFDR